MGSSKKVVTTIRLLTQMDENGRELCRAAQEQASARHTVSILTERNKTWFSHLRISLTRIQPNLLQRCPPGRRLYIPNLTQIAPSVFEIRVPKVSFFFFLFFVFLHTYKNRYKTRTHARIKLKLGTQNRRIKKNLRTNFSANPKISGVKTICSHKTRSICCHAYRVNHFEEWVEIWHVDGVNIIGVPFVVWKESGKRPRRYDTKPNWCKNYAIKFVNKNFTGLIKFTHSHVTHVISIT